MPMLVQLAVLVDSQLIVALPPRLISIGVAVTTKVGAPGGASGGGASGGGVEASSPIASTSGTLPSAPRPCPSTTHAVTEATRNSKLIALRMRISFRNG